MKAAPVAPTAARCRRAIFVTMSTVALLALAATATLTVLSVREVLIDRHAALLENVAAGRARMLHAIERGWRDKVTLIAAQPGLREALSRLDTAAPPTRRRDRRLGGHLRDIERSVAEVASIRVFDPRGRLVASTRVDEPPAANGGVVDATVTLGREAARVLAYRARPGGTARIDLAAPIVHEGALVGILALALDTGDIARVAADHTALGASGETLVVRRLDGGAARLLTVPRHPPHRVFAVRGTGPATPIAYAARGRAGTVVDRSLRDYRGEPVLAAIEVLAPEALAVVAKTDRAEVLAPLWRLSVPLTAACVLLAIGVLVAMRGLAVHLTRRLADSESRVAAIVDNAADGIVWLDGEQRVRALNPAAEHLLSTRADACVNRRFDAIETVVERLGIALALDRLLTGEPPVRRVWRGDLHIADGDGCGRDLEAAATVCALADGPFVGLTLHDVTERNRQRRQLERALRDEQASRRQQREFVATVSHDFRTPLAVIDATAQQLLRRPLPREKRGARLQQIRDSVGRLTDLIEQVLASVRAERPESPLHLSRLSLTRLIGACVAEVRRLHPERVVWSMAPPEDVWIDGDATAIHQIVENLLTNALKYSPEPTPVAVTLAKFDDVVRLFVIDRGCGIPAADLDAVFERFHRAGNVGSVHGTGLGLHIARELAVAHGGGITVASEEGVGAVFAVTLPAAGPPTGMLVGL